MAEAAAAAAAERESDLRSVFADEARELREEARAALARAAAAEAETGASLRALADAERRWAEQRARLEDEAAQAAESAEVVAAEAERLRAETVALRAEGAQREATNARARAGGGSGEGSGVASDEGEGGTSSAPASSESSSSAAAAGLLARTAEAEAEASRLADSLEAAEGEVHRWRATVEQARAERAEAEARTAEVRSRAETETAALRAELDRRPTCAERAALRREVATLKRVLFSSALRPRREDKGRGSSSRPRLGLGGESAAGAEADEEEDDDSGSVVSDAGSTVSDTLSDAGGEQDPDDEEGAARKRRTLTESALRRVRHLEAVVLARRRELEGARAECSRLREELDGARETIQDLRGDVAKLEREATVLAGASEAGSAGGGRGEALAQPGAAARAGDRRPARGEDGAPVGGSAGAQGAGDSARDALEEAIGHSRKAAATVQGTAGGVGGTDASAAAASQAGEGGGERRAGEALPAAQAVPPASVADVLRSQRNRFRARVGELEGEVSLAQRAAAEAEAAREALESDNVALWEAVRLVRRSPGLTDAEIAARIGSRDALPRYGRLFRERTDPFAALEAGRAEGAAVRRGKRLRRRAARLRENCVGFDRSPQCATHGRILVLACRREGVAPLGSEIRTGALGPRDFDGWFTEVEAMWKGQRFSIEVEKVLLHKKSKYQVSGGRDAARCTEEILVFDSKTWGRVLVLDGVIQLTTSESSRRDECSYQEMMAHVPLFCHQSPDRVLIVGGGDGGVLREVVKHGKVSDVTLCEIDTRAAAPEARHRRASRGQKGTLAPGPARQPRVVGSLPAASRREVIAAAKEFFGDTVATAFDDEAVTIVVEDAAEFLKTRRNMFDVIIVDSSDPTDADAPATALYKPAFLKSCSDALRDGGILCMQ
ncbi:unnamed protein product, partial [Symbiodinium sp. KB8]